MAEPIARLFTHDPAVVPLAASCLRIISYGNIGYAYGMVMLQAFNGAGDTVTPTIVNFFGFWMLEIPLAYWLAIPMGLHSKGAYIAIVIAKARSPPPARCCSSAGSGRRRRYRRDLSEPGGKALSLHPQRPEYPVIHRCLPIFFRDYAKRSRVVPHRPANAVLFERCPHIVQPRGAVLRIGIFPVHAKLVAQQRNPAPARPLRCLLHFGCNACRVPVLMPTADHLSRSTSSGTSVAARSADSSRRILHSPQPMPVILAPGRALMGEECGR